ncbi:retrovirus-related pol polyprotein from transposon TNT 1-94 [Tanacetum coccineum]
MAARKRRRTYTFMSEMPRSTHENNDNQEVDTNVSHQDPVQTPVQTHVQTPVHTAIEDNQDTPLEDSSQELTRNNTTDASVQSSLASNGSGSSTTNDVRKKGRGPALGYQGKEKIKIIFNERMQPIRDSSTDLANLLGGIAKCGAHAPLNIVSWKSMPNTYLELMWRDVQHKIDAPEHYKDTCLKLIGGHWKKWKSRVKHDFFTPNKDDSEKLLTPPSNSRAQSLKNSNNQKNLEFLPRTGRTSHANVREEMKANNEDLCRANVFIKTRTANNGSIPDEDTRIVVQVFIDLVGPDGHGSVKTFGGGVSSRNVFGTHSLLRNTTSSDAIERMVQAQVAAQLEAKDVNNQLPQILPTAISSFATPIIEKNVTESLEVAVLAKSSSQPQSSYAMTASLSEFELIKILMDKMEKNKSYLRVDYKRELYDSLVNSYNTDKDLFDTYGEAFILKRGQDDKDKDQGPSARLDQGKKRKKLSKERESSKDPRSKEGKTSSSTKDTSRSHKKSSGKFAHIEEPSHNVED